MDQVATISCSKWSLQLTETLRDAVMEANDTKQFKIQVKMKCPLIIFGQRQKGVFALYFYPLI